ncbi:MAG: hypothetical protein WED09_04045 [Homoserinimonas sp.]
MTFDQYANQGDTAAWDPEAAAATKRAADKIFNGEPDHTAPDDASDAETDDNEGTAVKQDPHPPSEVPDPDITRDP